MRAGCRTAHGESAPWRRPAHAVSDLSVQVAEGQLLCLVGESGSGKSITAHTVMGLLPSNMRATAGRFDSAERTCYRRHRSD